MEQKAKFIIIGLMGILVISLFINLKTHSSKLAVQREKDNLKKENESLTAKIEETMRNSKLFEDKINLLSRDLDRVSQEKEEFQRRFEFLTKERDELSEELKRKNELVGKLKQPPRTDIQEAQKSLAVPAQAAGGDAYWAGILRTKTDLELQLENMRNELKEVHINNEQLQREKGMLDLELKNLTHEKQDLEQQIEYNQKTVDSLTSELFREKDAKRQFQDSLRFAKNENAILRRQLKSLSNRKVDLEMKLAKLQEEKNSFERKFTEMSLLLEDKFSQINELRQRIETLRSPSQAQTAQFMPQSKKESVELPPIVVRPQETSLEQAAINRPGRVIAINKDYNFVIVDLGEDDGIRIDQTLSVYKDDQAVATVEVVQVRKSIAAADIKNQIASIAIGDAVR